MKIFKLLLSEKRDKICHEGVHEKFIKAHSRDEAYDKALIVASTLFNNYYDAPTIPDKDFIFWFDGDDSAVWINSLEELKVI